MKAAVYDRYGPPEVVRLVELPKPSAGEQDVLIRVRATTVSSGDWRARSLSVPGGFAFLAPLVFGIRRPRQRVLGTELSGDIEAVGKNVTAFKPGDAVVAFAGAKMGCHAEYVTMRQDRAIVAKPANLTYQEAASISFGGMTALSFLRRGRVRAGETVLVNGASGAVGSAMVQLARNLGAEVTGVTSTANVELVKSLGADRVIDYTKDDFLAGGASYDVIVDTAGTAPFRRAKAALKDGGRLIAVLGSMGDLLRAPLVAMTGNKRIVAGPAAERPADLRELADLAAAGKYRPLVDRVYPFEQIVDAHRYVDAGHKKGSVVITLA
jgi:NADPH:quinone reductase-like Zn-dependent oxidoreductase